jgi:hypothetical protein
MRSPTLNRLRATFWTELRLLVFSWIYPSLHLLWAVFLILMFVGSDNRSAQGLLETTLGRLSIGMISLVGLFLTAISASRSSRVKFLDLEESFPTGFEGIAGRWLAGMLALMLFLIEPIVIAAQQGPINSLWDELPIFLAEASLTIAFTTSLAWLLLSGIKTGRWAYALLTGAWLGFLLGPTLLAGRYPPASLLNFMRQGVSFYSELWGRVVYGSQPTWFNLFYLGLFVLCMAALILRQTLRRFNRLSLPGMVLLVAALFLAGLGGSRYVAGVQAAELAQAVPQTSPLPIENLAFTVTDYRIMLDMADPILPRFHTQITVLNTGTEPMAHLVFRLNPALTVKQASLPVEQGGGWITVQLAQPLASGSSLSLSLDYEGPLRMETVSERVVEATDFIDSQGVRLTPQAHWYPVPASVNQPAGLHYPVHMRLEIKNSNGLPFAANLPSVGANTFEADAAGWVFLIASPRLVIEQAGSTTLITSQADLEVARKFAYVFEDPLQSIAPFFPDAKVKGMTLMVLGEEGGLPEDTPAFSGQPIIITQRYTLEFMAGNSNQNPYSNRSEVCPLTADLWRLNGGTLDSNSSGPLTGLDEAFSVTCSFLSLYVKENGDSQQILSTLQNEIPLLGVVDENQVTLAKIYQQGGQKAVAAVFKQMALRSNELRSVPPADLSKWILSAGGAQ